MKKVETDQEIIAAAISLEEKSILDIGCGMGGLVHWLNSQGAYAVGLDTLEMMGKAKKEVSGISKHFLAGVAERLPLKNDCMDAVVYFASLHHIPREEICNALKECHRVLKSKGKAVIVEPVGRKGSYFEVVRLVEDEREIQKLALSAIKAACRIGLKPIEEEFVFFERTYQDYQQLIETFVDDQKEASQALSAAKEVFLRFAQDRGVAWNNFVFRSICRINILEKKSDE